MSEGAKYVLDITVDKYRVTQDDKGALCIWRGGDMSKPWMGSGSEYMGGSVPGAKMIIALACEVAHQREEVERYRKHTGIVGFNGDCGIDSGAPIYKRDPVPLECKECSGCSDCLTNTLPFGAP